MDDEALDRLADELAPRIADRIAARDPEADRWLTTAEAADYIGRSTTALHKLTAARAIPFEQAGPGARCYFRRANFDRRL